MLAAQRTGDTSMQVATLYATGETLLHHGSLQAQDTVDRTIDMIAELIEGMAEVDPDVSLAEIVDAVRQAKYMTGRGH
jgi:hypothetical protein